MGAVAAEIRPQIHGTAGALAALRERLRGRGWAVRDTEPLKLTIDCAASGWEGIRPQIHGVPGGGEKAQVGPVGVVHQQGYAPAVGYSRQGRHIAGPAQVVRAGDVHRRRARLLQGPLQGHWRHRAGAQALPRGLRPASGSSAR